MNLRKATAAAMGSGAVGWPACSERALSFSGSGTAAEARKRSCRGAILMGGGVLLLAMVGEAVIGIRGIAETDEIRTAHHAWNGKGSIGERGSLRETAAQTNGRGTRRKVIATTCLAGWPRKKPAKESFHESAHIRPEALDGQAAGFGDWIVKEILDGTESKVPSTSVGIFQDGPTSCQTCVPLIRINSKVLSPASYQVKRSAANMSAAGVFPGGR